jgi:hypothetical protein
MNWLSIATAASLCALALPSAPARAEVPDSHDARSSRQVHRPYTEHLVQASCSHWTTYIQTCSCSWPQTPVLPTITCGYYTDDSGNKCSGDQCYGTCSCQERK